MKKMFCKPATMDVVKEKNPSMSTSKAGAKKKKTSLPLQEPEVMASSSGVRILFALEPRIMFDGAALATGAEVIQDTTTQDQTGIPGIDGDTSTDSINTDTSDNDALWTSGLSFAVPSDRKEIVFIDTSVDDYHTLMKGIDPNAEVILLDSTRDGIEQIAEILGERTDIDAIHLISHGDSGELRLGTGVLNLASMQGEYADELVTINQALTEKADFLIYGCNFGEGDTGREAATLLAELTGADIGASDDLTGSTELGGDWDLEVQTGTIESNVIVAEQAQEDFAGVLDITTGLVGHWTFDADATDSSPEGNDGTLQGNAFIDTTDATDIVGEGKLSLDGADDYVDLSAHTADYDNLSEGTFSAWVNFTGTGNQTILYFTNNTASPSSIRVSVEGGQLGVRIIKQQVALLNVTSSATINDGNWHHIAFTTSASGNQLFIDGQQLTGGDLTYSTGSSATTTFFDDLPNMNYASIGIVTPHNIGDFQGLLDDARIYDRALSAADIDELVNLAPSDLEATVTTDGGLSLNEDGGNDAYLIADDGGAIIGGLTSLTAEVRFSMDSFSNSTNFFSYATASDDNVFKFNIRDNGDLSVSINSVKIDSAAMDYRTLADGQQHTLSVTWNSTGGAWEMFVDGASVDSGSGLESGVTLAGGGALVIGNDQDSVDGGYDPAAEVAATLYDARIFNDIRTAGEIATNYDQTLANTEPGMVANWTFNDLSTNGVVTDTVSANNMTVMHASGGGFVSSTPVLTLQVDENVANGTVVGTITGTDPESDPLTYSLTDDAGGRFTIHPTSGVITVADGSLLDYEANTSHNITVRVSDGVSTYDEVYMIDVNNVSPTTISASGVSTVVPGATYTLNLSANEDVTSWTINWGDGTIETIAGNPSSVTHVYAASTEGLTYNVIVSAADADGMYTSSNLLTASRMNNTIYMLDGNTGQVDFTLQSTPLMNSASDVVIGPDGHIYATSDGNNSVLKYDGATGALIGTFVTSGSGGISTPFSLTFGSDGHLYVSSYDSDEVMRYDGTTGAFIDVFVTAGSGGVDGPNTLQFGPDGDLYVGGWFSHTVVRYDGQTGAFIQVVADTGASSNVTDFVFGPNNRLYVGSLLGPQIRVYDTTTWTQVDSFATTGTPYSLVFGPEGHLYVSAWTQDRVDIYDVNTKAFLGTFADSSVGLDNTWGINFTPDQQVTITADNDTPVNNVPGAQTTNEDTAIVFNTLNSNLISITDDAGELLNVTVSVTNGTLTVSEAGGATVSNDGTANVILSGTVEDINLALDGLQYDPTPDYNGSDTLTMTTSDATLLALNLDANLQGYYEFTSGDPAGDTSPGGTNDGTLNGDASVTTDATRGDVLSLDGDRDYVNINSVFSNPANVTLAAWVNYTSSDLNGGEVITLGNDIALRVDDWSNGVTGFFWDGTTHQFISSGISLADGNWHHIAFTFNDTANTQTLYIDGVEVASAVFSSSITYTGTFPQTRIGTHANDADIDFDYNGLIDDARIYDRALSASEIADLVSAPVAVSDSDTVAITVDPVNDVPMNTVPGGQAVAEDTAMNITGLSVNDVDGNLSTVQLAVTQGTVTVTLSGGATISSGANGTSTLTLSGTQADINATLASLNYQGNLNYTGADMLTMTSTDSNSATDVDTVNITVGLFVDTTEDYSNADGKYGDTSSIAALLLDKGTDGLISLREAIDAANNSVGLDTIGFNIGLTDAGHVYYQNDGVANSLTTIAPTTLADGSIADFDPDYVGGAAQGFSWWRMQPTSLLPTITDVVIIDATTQTGWQAGRPVIELNGALAGTGANFNGLTVNSSAGSTIQGLAINQFDWAGIQLNGGGGHTVVGNFLGTDITGTLDFGNRINGIEASNSSNNVIGGVTQADRNVIAGNNQGEVSLGFGTGNTLQGNYLGVDVTGMNRLGNSFGLRIYGDSNQIGGTGMGEENVIAGIRLETSAQTNTFEGNLIGTDAAGTASLGLGWGMVVYGSNNVIGGTVTDAGNVISGNSVDGILFSGTSAIGNVVQGNYIGTDITGTLTLGNGDGVQIGSGATNNTIGGSTAGARNIISGNTSDGIEISGATTTGNVVQGNYIGTDVTGTLNVGNTVAGIRLDGANNIIGGATALERNVIAGNSSGITISSVNATGNVIEGNYIGTDATGAAALGNSYGVWITAGSNNVIGGTVAGAANVISGNTQNGVYLTGANTTQNIVQRNYIGTNSSNLNLGNGSAGILISNSAANNLLGGIPAGAGNTIAYNSGDGIWVNTDAGTNNSILGNAIYSNTSIGIDLGNDNVTANDLGDADTGANDLQNMAVLSTAVTSGSYVTITGSLNSTANTTFRIEFFASAVADGTNNGEAERYLGFATVTTDGAGNATINTTLTVSVAVGEFLTSTVTVDLGAGNYGDTSEFAQNVVAIGANAPVITSNGGGANAGLSLAENLAGVTTMTATDADGDPLTYSLVGGADAARFAINPTTGTLQFVAAPDFETPTDVGADNVYDVQVQVSDGQGGTDTQTLAITVTDILEGTAPPSPPPSPDPTPDPPSEPSPEPVPEPDPETPSGDTESGVVASAPMTDGGLAGPGLASRGLEEGAHLPSNGGVVNILDLPPLLRPASWATTSDQIRAYYPDPLDMTKTELSSDVLQQLTKFSDELGQSMEDQAEERSWFAKTMKGAGFTLSAGFVAWMVRGGALMAGMMASLPAWRHFDPVPILNMDKQEKETWRLRVKEAAKMEAHEHQGLEQILQGPGHEEPVLPTSSFSETKPPDKFS